MKELFLDTETSGMPLFKERSNHPGQPHICEAAAMLVIDGAVAGILNSTCQRDGWTVCEETREIHGITDAELDAGIPEIQVVRAVAGLMAQADRMVGWRIGFDLRVLRIAATRIPDAGLDPDLVQAFPRLDLAPIYQGATSQRALSLEQAYAQVMGKELERPHRALSDVHACMVIYDWLAERGHIQIPAPVDAVRQSVGLAPAGSERPAGEERPKRGGRCDE